MQLSQKENNFSEFFAGILKAAITFRYFEKKMTLIDFDFPKLLTPETWSGKRLKCSVSDIPSTSNMLNVPKHCWKLHHSTFIIFIDHYQDNWVGESLSYWHANSWDCSLFNTLLSVEKYPVFNRDNLTIPIQMQLSEKHKTFCQFFTAFLKSGWNFEHFDKKDDAHRFCNFEIMGCENLVR